jgi:hypothetical protein
VDPTTKRAAVAKLLAKLGVRERLKQLAQAYHAHQLSADELELARVRDYLDAWVRHQEKYRPRLGLPSSSAFAPALSNARTASEYHERSDAWMLQQVDAAVEEDLPILEPDGRAMWLALRMRWLNVKVGPRVFRSGRLRHLDPAEVDDLADAAERALIPMFKRRKLPLLP